MDKFTVESGRPFQWRRGLRLQATEETQFILPGALWVDGEAIRTVIDVSDDNVRLAIDQSDDGRVKSFHIYLEPGQYITLHRSSEAIAIALEKKEVELKVFWNEDA